MERVLKSLGKSKVLLDCKLNTVMHCKRMICMIRLVQLVVVVVQLLVVVAQLQLLLEVLLDVGEQLTANVWVVKLMECGLLGKHSLLLNNNIVV